MYCNEEGGRNVEGSLCGDGIDRSGDDDILCGLYRWEAAPPSFGAGGGNNDVVPGHLDMTQSDGSKDCDQCMNQRVAASRSKDVEDEAVGQVVDDRDMETAERGQAAALCFKVLDSRGHLCGDWLLLDEEQVGFHKLHLLGLLFLREDGSVDFFQGIIRVNLESCGGGSFDHGKSTNDIAIGVRDLKTGVSLEGVGRTCATKIYSQQTSWPCTKCL